MRVQLRLIWKLLSTVARRNLRIWKFSLRIEAHSLESSVGHAGAGVDENGEIWPDVARVDKRHWGWSRRQSGRHRWLWGNCTSAIAQDSLTRRSGVRACPGAESICVVARWSEVLRVELVHVFHFDGGVGRNAATHASKTDGQRHCVHAVHGHIDVPLLQRRSAVRDAENAWFIADSLVEIGDDDGDLACHVATIGINLSGLLIG